MSKRIRIKREPRNNVGGRWPRKRSRMIKKHKTYWTQWLNKYVKSTKDLEPRDITEW